MARQATDSRRGGGGFVLGFDCNFLRHGVIENEKTNQGSLMSKKSKECKQDSVMCVSCESMVWEYEG